MSQLKSKTITLRDNSIVVMYWGALPMITYLSPLRAIERLTWWRQNVMFRQINSISGLLNFETYLYLYVGIILFIFK